jgi:hypothetical protein
MYIVGRKIRKRKEKVETRRRRKEKVGKEEKVEK